MLGTYKKYQIKTSKLYEKIKMIYYKAELHKTTTGRKWVTNGTIDIFLKVGEQIPDGFYSGRSYGGGEKLKQFGLKISERGKGRTPWNKGKHGCYSDEYRKKISENHADVSGKNNALFGRRMMFDIKTQTQVFVFRDDIQKYLDMGYVEKRKLKVYNNGKIVILSDKKPGDDFKIGRLKKKK